MPHPEGAAQGSGEASADVAPAAVREDAKDRVVHARDRLAQAITRLEEAADSAIAAAHARQRDLEASRAESVALRDTQELLRKRLDAAISRLRNVLRPPPVD